MHIDLRRATRWTALALVAATLPVLSGASVGATAASAEPTPALLSKTGGGTIDEGLLTDLETGDDVAFNVAAETDVVGTVREHGTHDDYESWTGSLADGGFFTVVRAGRALRVHVASLSGTYDVTQTRGSAAQVAEVDLQEHAKAAGERRDYLVPPASERGPARAPSVGGDSGALIDMMIVFTPQAAAELGGREPALAAVGTVIEQTNITFSNSQIPTRVRLVAVGNTAQNQLSNDIYTELNALTTNGDGIYDELHALRNVYHADQVSLLTASASAPSCGLGWIGAADARAFTVTEARCLNNYTMTHELGHNLGADHDRYPGVTNAGLTADAAGLVNVGARWITMMAYDTACTNVGVACGRILVFSNPAVTFNGVPTGNASANNARVVAASSPVMANFRQEQIYPGALTYTGKARFKETLSVSSTAWTPAGVSVGYQWYDNGQPIAGATGTSVYLSREHIGHSVSVSVTGNAPYYPATAVSSAPLTVKKAKFRAKRPVLKGKPRVGRVLSVKLKRFKPKKKVKVRYSWFRNGKKIKGAKGRKYRVRRTDRKDKIRCMVKLKKKNYATAKLRTRKIKIKR